MAVHQKYVVGDINSKLVNKNKRRDIIRVIDSPGWYMARLHLEPGTYKWRSIDNDFIVTKEKDLYKITDGHISVVYDREALLEALDCGSPSFGNWIVTIA